LSAPDRKVSKSAVRRLSRYLRALDDLTLEGEEVVSSGDLARQAGTTAAQVRKDLSLFGSFGKRGLGYEVSLLRSQLREIMGLTRRWRVALVGAGRIGAALFEYPPFRERGFEIVAIFDNDPRKIAGTSIQRWVACSRKTSNGVRTVPWFFERALRI
jgi:redox-sensing transcriptional repressor